MHDKGDDENVLLASWCKALGHPVRIRILCVLRGRQTCACGAIVDEVGLAQSTVSQHLKILKDAGIVRGNIDGPRTCYCLDPDTMAAMAGAVSAILAPLEPLSCCDDGA